MPRYTTQGSIAAKQITYRIHNAANISILIYISLPVIHEPHTVIPTWAVTPTMLSIHTTWYNGRV